MFKVITEKDFKNIDLKKLRGYILIGVNDIPVTLKEMVSIVTLVHTDILKYEITSNKIRLTKNTQDKYLVLRTHKEELLKYCKFRVGFRQKEEYKTKIKAIEKGVKMTEISLIYNALFTKIDEAINDNNFLPFIINEIIEDFYIKVLFPLEVRLNKREDLYDKYPMILPDISTLNPTRLFYEREKSYLDDKLYFYELCLNFYDDILTSYKERIFNASKNFAFMISDSSNINNDGIIELYKFLTRNDLPFVSRKLDNFIKDKGNSVYAYISFTESYDNEYIGVFSSTELDEILSEEKLTYEDIIRRDNKEKYLNDVKIDGNMIISRNLNKVENLIRKTSKTINDMGLSRQIPISC